MLSEGAEVMERLNRIGHMIGRIFGVDIGVDESGDRLIFVDENEDPIMADGDEIIAASPEEIQNKDVGEFAARALRAAMLLKYQEIERSRAP